MSIFRRFFWFLGISRIEPRRPSRQRVTLTWRDRHGQGVAYAACRDISPAGMGIECCEPIPVNTRVVAYIENDVIPASIRYRKVHGGTYRLGLEFIDSRRPNRSL